MGIVDVFHLPPHNDRESKAILVLGLAFEGFITISSLISQGGRLIFTGPG